MGILICTGITSLDGYIADENGNFDWSAPSDEVHTFINDLERAVGTYLYGRRLYEVMVAWETMHLDDDNQPAVMRDYTALWQAADKIVYSSTLTEPSSRRTRIERSFDPEAVRELKRTASGNLSIGGPHLAAQAFAAGLVDEVQLFVSPVVVGGGTKFLPDNLALSLELKDEYAFRNGVVYLGYTVKR
ncbi:dihydrofolate reductase family protein [Cryobacterium arcticum]|uniref:Deaminase n=1 Tax=Cryobacterium arcticum TaxID=670052 RepID=A0A317ZX65_9MICO|nr:dihydrofolate reductase family protein [Cryobacterium arcticum]PXA71973.1 deaminase [Cryobacterium arcticum]